MRLVAAYMTVMVLGVLGYTWIPPLAKADEGQDGQLGHGYSRKAGHVFFENQRIDQAGRNDIDRFAKAVGHPLILCKDVDALSFAALSEEYTKDKNKVYYKWISPGRFWVVELADADPATFAVLDFNLAKDRNRVWRGDCVIDGADAATAVVIRPHWTWKDRNYVYYQKTVITGADAATFRHLGQGFCRDAKRVYWGTDPLPGADPDSFQTFGDESPYARDRRHVWSGKSVLDGVEAASFNLLHDHVFKDSKRVYVGTRAQEVLHADAGTFVKVARLEPGNAMLFRDRSRHYVYDPSYSEIYALEPKDDAILVWKPVWRQTETEKPVHGATVSARLKDGALTEPDVAMEPEFKKDKPPTWEKDKLKALKLKFVAAQKEMVK